MYLNSILDSKKVKKKFFKTTQPLIYTFLVSPKTLSAWFLDPDKVLGWKNY